MEEDGSQPDSARELQPSVAQDGAGSSREEAQADQVDSNSALEILVDGSELLTEGVGSHETEGQQNELADRLLDGVEVGVSLDGALQLGLGGPRPDRDSCVVSTEAHPQTLPIPRSDAVENADVSGIPHNGLPAPNRANGLMDCGNSRGSCEEGDDNAACEKKRSREEKAEEGRCLKLRTMEVKVRDLQSPPRSVVECAEHVKHDPEIDSNGENLHDSAGVTNGGQNVVIEGAVNDSKEACTGHVIDDMQSKNGSMDFASASNIDDNKESTANGRERMRRGKRRKIAMLLAYCGAGYQGMQKNPGAVTIEGLLEEALSKAGAMPPNYDGNPRRVDWMRAARTDKGVSAVGQVVSGLFYIEPPGFVERVNAHLPDPIRLLGYRRVTPTFCAKKFCDRRRYEYVIPIFALDPSTHRDREAVLASEGKEDAFIKCLECSERGRKIPAGKVIHKSSPDKPETDICDDQCAMLESQSTNGMTIDTSITVTTSVAEQSYQGAISPEFVLPVDSDVHEEEEIKHASLDASAMLVPKKEPFHFGDAERERLNNILGRYVGTHNFHNFTSRTKAEDPSAKRYIVSFEAVSVFTVGNMEFVRCVVVGQSFMLHQIRKMIGLAVAIFRGFAPESVIETALRRDTHITIPTAPELGLFLDECLYPAYNQKWRETHEEVSQKGYEQEIHRFKHEVIYRHIQATENKEGQMALFLHSLNDRNYADLASAREDASVTVALQSVAS